MFKLGRQQLMKVASCGSVAGHLRLYSAGSSLSNSIENPGKVVFISQSSDVYANLALEDWFYRNWTFDKRCLLLLWRNKPCVVIGRHQNPFIEANLTYLESADVPIARRNSGGGTVYHDEGNLNCTFFTSRNRYNRHENLSTICEALENDFKISAEINKRDDIIVEGQKKISGTAAKLGRLSAYHHCTVLVSTDKTQLKLALAGDKTMESNATQSIPSSTANINELHEGLNVESLLGSIGMRYLERDADRMRSDGFTLVNPTEDWFPGLDELKDKIKSWDWINGMTPLFSITRPVALNPALSEGSSVLVKVEAFRGLITKLSTVGHVGRQLKYLLEEEIGTTMKGVHYGPEVFSVIEAKLEGNGDLKKHSASR